MSVLVTSTASGVVMAADTRETALLSGSVRVLETGKILRTTTVGGEDVLIGVVGNANHFGLLRYMASKSPLTGASYEELFAFFASFYDEAQERSVHVFGDEGESYSEFHVAFVDSAWLVRGLTIEPVYTYMTSGSGADLALGALEANADIMTAISIACNNNSFCYFPIDVWKAEDGRFVHSRLDSNLREISSKEPLAPTQDLPRSEPRRI